MSKQHLNLEANNLKVVAYVPVDKMSKINNNSRAEVVVNKDVSFKAAVTVLGTRTEMIPENLRSYFSKKNTAVIAILHLDKNQTVPLWALASGMPVSVRIKNYSWFSKEEEKPQSDKPDYLWFTTGQGMRVTEKNGHIYPMSDSIATRDANKEKTVKKNTSKETQSSKRK